MLEKKIVEEILQICLTTGGDFAEVFEEHTYKSNIRMLNGIVEDIRFDGIACTISTASTSIMSDLLKGKSIKEAKEIIQNYYQMIDQKDYDEAMLDEAIAFHNVGKQANRIKCATIGWKAIEALIEESEAAK